MNIKIKTGAYWEDKKVHKLFKNEKGEYWRRCRPGSKLTYQDLILVNQPINCQMCDGSRQIYNRFIERSEE